MRISLNIQSGLDFEIKYALDFLVLCSVDGTLNFKEAPFLLDALCNLMETRISYTIKSQAPDTKFIPYHEMYEIELEMSEKMGSKIDPFELSIGLIIRNASFFPDNLPVMSCHNILLQILYATLNIKYPSPIIQQFQSGSFFINQYHSLEHRKNSFITLTNLAPLITLTEELAHLILDVCLDFLADEGSPYEFATLDLLSKLVLNERNRVTLTRLGLKPLSDKLTDKLPNVWPKEPTQNQLSNWELIMVILLTIIADTGCNFPKKFLGLCRRPGGPASVHFENLRERCSVILRELDIKEEDLIALVMNCMKDGDPLMAMACSITLADISTK